jgi:hypothetical protein
MLFYWKMSEELKYLGETLIFVDPSLNRNFYAWIKKHAQTLAMAEGLSLNDLCKISLN